MRLTTQLMARTFGALMGLAGLEHGIGEILQGNVPPGGLMILSWPGSDFFHVLGGEPALTIVPSLLYTGVLALIFSLAYLTWSVAFIDRPSSPLVLALLAAGMLLFGGGVFPPILGMLVALLAARIHRPAGGDLDRASRMRPGFVAWVWPWSFGACLAAWLVMCPGLCLLDHYLGIDTSDLLIAVIAVVLITTAATVVLGLARDAL